MGTSDARAVAVVLAGGLGTRVSALHPDVPKPMIEVAGAPFLRWVVQALRERGVARVVLSAGHLAHVVEAWAATRPVPGVELTTAREPRPLGTAGGTRFALSAVEGEAWDVALVLNGDSLVMADLGPAIAAARGGAVAIVGVEVDDASRFGTLEVAPDGALRAFREKRPGRALVNAGVYALPRFVALGLPAGPSSFERDVFPGLLAAGARVVVTPSRAPFIDMGVPEDLARAPDFVRAHVAPSTGPRGQPR